MPNKENPNKVESSRNLDTRIQRPVTKLVSVDLTGVTADRHTLLYLTSEIRVKEIITNVEGSTPSAVWNIEYSEDQTNFTGLFNSNETTDSTTIPQKVYPDVQTVPANQWLWINVASVGGTVDHFRLTVAYDG